MIEYAFGPPFWKILFRKAVAEIKTSQRRTTQRIFYSLNVQTVTALIKALKSGKAVKSYLRRTGKRNKALNRSFKKLRFYIRKIFPVVKTATLKNSYS